MLVPKTAFGFPPLDEILNGGVEHGVITNVYGEAGAGKSNLMLLLTTRVIANGGHVIFVDTEGSFSVERLQQLIEQAEHYMDNITIIEPTDFDEQHHAIGTLHKHIQDNTQLVVLDSLVTLYRIAADKDAYEERNRQLAQQLATLFQTARAHTIPVVMTTQVYTNFNNGQTLELVSRDVAKYWSKCLLKVEKGHKNERIATITKHRSRPEGSSCRFVIKEDGLGEVKGTRLF